MAVVFELVVDFREDEKAAQAYSDWLVGQPNYTTAAAKRIELHRPLLQRTKQWGIDNFYVSLIPVGVGHGVALDVQKPKISLGKEEFVELGLKLYDRVRGVPHYQLAMVGWDVDNWLSLEELKADWTKEISEGSLKGLVVSKTVLPELPTSEHFAPFDNDHDWIPYR